MQSQAGTRRVASDGVLDAGVDRQAEHIELQLQIVSEPPHLHRHTPRASGLGAHSPSPAPHADCELCTDHHVGFSTFERRKVY